MTNEDILYKAILKAEKNGYKDHLRFLPILVKINDLFHLSKKCFYAHKTEIIFSHNFAKAFWGNTDTIYSKDAWVRKLEEMSQEINEIKFLEKYI